MGKENLTERFKLPSYVKGKSFAEASKIIKNKFKDRDDAISQSTMNSLLERLKEAQEYTRAKQEFDSRQVNPQQDQMFLGGVLDAVKGFAGGKGVAGQGVTDALEGLSGSTTGNFAQGLSQALGTTDPNVSSAIGGGVQAATGLLSGNPVDAAMGLVKGITGGVNALNKTHLKEQLAEDRKESSKYMNQFNTNFAKGGYMNKYEDGSYLGTWGDMDGSQGDTEETSTTEEGGNNFSWKNSIADIMRASSTGMTLKQLGDLQKPAQYNAPKLTQRYKPNIYDEAAGEARVKNIQGGLEQGLANAAAGSAGALRSALLASSLQKHKMRSDEAMKAKAANMAEQKAKQASDMEAARVNLGQLNLQDDINARNLGAFESQKGTLQAALAKSLEGHGTEEINKSRLEELFDYNWLGQYLKNKQ